MATTRMREKKPGESEQVKKRNSLQMGNVDSICRNHHHHHHHHQSRKKREKKIDQPLDRNESNPNDV